MKRILAALLAVMLVMSASVTAFGANQYEVNKKIESAADFIIAEYEESGFTAASVKNFLRLVRAGADVSDYEEDFLASAADALANLETDGDTKIMLIETFIELDKYPESFTEQAAKDYMENAVVGNAYIFADAIRVCLEYGMDSAAESFANALCGYYTLGTGAVFWGSPDWMSGDDNAMFIVALAPLASSYAAYIDDALGILENYYSEDGYTSYGAPNTDTTALALAAYSALGDKEKADEIYAMLVDNFYNSETGGFIADYDALYATSDAIFGMGLYLPIADEVLTGWQYVDGNWRYFREDGTTRKGWALDGRFWYYTDSFGVPMRGWLLDGGKWYYLDSNGIMQTGWQQIGGKWYYMNAYGAMQTGWQYLSGSWYYMNASGAMQTGWQQIGGKWYYLSKSGAMLTGWVKDGGSWYYLNGSGAMHTGWLLDGGKWYYLNSNGAMRTASLKYKGKTYMFNSSGACTNP